MPNPVPQHGTKRIYKYVDQHGNEFWSFVLLPKHTIRQMALEHLRGEHFRKHIDYVQKEALGLNATEE